MAQSGKKPGDVGEPSSYFDSQSMVVSLIARETLVGGELRRQRLQHAAAYAGPISAR